MTDNIEKWATAVGVATGVESIRFLTMLPWKAVFSAQGLIRAKRAWCAYCYEEWRRRDLEIYEPLLWMLEAVSVCPSHHRSLTTICPHCRREPYVMSSRSYPGHCSSCGQWLGVENVSVAGEAADLDDARSVVEQVATLLTPSPTIQRPLSGETLRTNLRSCVSDLAEGNESLFERAVGIHPKSVETWHTGQMLPSLRGLLKICLRLELPLLRFLTEPMTPGDSVWEHAREVVRQYRMPRARSLRIAAAHTVIEEALHASEPRSLLAVALKAGFKHERSLRKYDAEACRAIDERYRAMRNLKDRAGTVVSIPPARVEEVLEVALRQDPPPSLRDVSLALSLQDASWLMNRFPVQCRLLVERLKDYRRDRRRLVETVLRTALMEDPPPTVKEVAKRAGARGGQIRIWFPDLYHIATWRSVLLSGAIGGWQRYDWFLKR